MTASGGSAMSSQERSTGASSQSGVCKGWTAPVRRCYCGEKAPCQVSWSDKNPARRYYGCKYWPDDDVECGYFYWYDDAVSDWYRQVLNELKPKKKESKQIGSEIGRAADVEFVKVMLVLLTVLVIVLGVLVVFKG